MDYSQISLNNGLTFLAWASGIVILVVGGFLIKLLVDLSALAKNVNKITELMNDELKPTIIELKETLHSISSIVKSTDRGVDNFKSAVEKTVGKAKTVSTTLIGGIIKGFAAAYKFFSKK